MIPSFSIPKIKETQKDKRLKLNKLRSLSSAKPTTQKEVWTSIYVPIMEVLGKFLQAEFAQSEDYMPMFSWVKDRNRTVVHAFDGIVYSTLDGTDARWMLQRELKERMPSYGQLWSTGRTGNVKLIKHTTFFDQHPVTLIFCIQEAEKLK